MTTEIPPVCKILLLNSSFASSSILCCCLVLFMMMGAMSPAGQGAISKCA